MELKVYADRKSEPSRAILIFCKINGIVFEEVEVDLTSRKHLTPEFQEINPLRQVPAIVHGDFKLSESHAILRYLACAFPEVADHWYPSDLQKRAKVESLLDWHHTNLRFGTIELVRNTVLASALGIPPNLEVAARGEKVLCASLEKIAELWLNESGPFLLGNTQPSLADLCFVCEIMQLELLNEKDSDRILGPHKKVKQWVEATKLATSPYFEEMHGVLFVVKKMFQKAREESESKIINGIEYEEIKVSFIKRETSSPEFLEVNPMGEVLAIQHGDFKLYESHTILRYLACAFPGVADNWYPTDLVKRAKIDSVLDWHHLHLRLGTVTLVQSTALAPALGRQPNSFVISEAEKVLCKSLDQLQMVWLKDDSQFLLGNSQLSIADLILACELMQLELLDDKDHDRIFSPRKKVLKWIENVKHATAPYFEEMHQLLFETKEQLEK